MSDRFTGPITDEAVRKWAYDDDMELMDQDEDLLLHSEKYFPVLFEVAEDANCPKGNYALSIMDHFMARRALHSPDKPIAMLNNAIDHCDRSRRPEIRQWGELLKRRKLFLTIPAKVDKALAMEMAQNLFNGLYRDAEIAIVAETAQTWIVELSVQPFHRHKERMSIDKNTGSFSFRSSGDAGTTWY